MAFLPQRCPSAMPAPIPGPYTPPRLLHPRLDSTAEIPQLVQMWNSGSAIHHNLLGINKEKKKKSCMITFHDLNDDWFSNGLCSCLILSQLEEKNSAGGNGNESPALFYWEVWTERKIAFIRAAYCTCSTSVSPLDTPGVYSFIH